MLSREKHDTSRLTDAPRLNYNASFEDTVFEGAITDLQKRNVPDREFVIATKRFQSFLNGANHHNFKAYNTYNNVLICAVDSLV